MMKAHAAPHAHTRLRRALVAAMAALLCTLRAAASAPPEQAPTMMIAPPERAAMRFGETVATCGDLAVIGAPVDGDLGAGAGVAHVVRLSVREDGSWDCSHVVRLRSLGEGDHFGCAAAIAQDGEAPEQATVIAVGADRAWVRSGFEGAVYIFSDTDATPLHRLVAPLPQPGAEFGGAIASDATAATIAVGARREDVDGIIDCGAVHVFTRCSQSSARLAGRSGGVEGWHCTQSIRPPNPAMSLWFGSAVALGEHWLAVGVPGARASGLAGAGCVYVYERDTSGRFMLVRTVSSPTPSAQGWFGSALAIDGATLLVGEPRGMHSGVRSGAAWTVDLGAHDEPARRLAPQGPSNARLANIGFGTSVAIDSRVIVVGAPGLDDGLVTEDHGGGFVFLRNESEDSPFRVLESHARTPMLLCGSAAGIVRIGPDRNSPSARAALLGHLFVEEESVAPSPGVALYAIDDVTPSAPSPPLARDRLGTTSRASASSP